MKITMKTLLLLLLLTNPALAHDLYELDDLDDFDRQQLEVEREDNRNQQYRRMMGEEMRDYHEHNQRDESARLQLAPHLITKPIEH